MSAECWRGVKVNLPQLARWCSACSPFSALLCVAQSTTEDIEEQKLITPNSTVLRISSM
ncbi:uncharacterized protein PHALS_11029 [Plasmopara halstedii]|uniref:Uncharacterized protein n=1 Tax=Plasmopara halstedii TaxID=4781 RepID=A0A0P1AII4_PLAHL|nr:uncharacterized protein PHALS_11029 [Plasmopara halstedii]CEG40850.1 hypothetical protein PHALS_11029 [Plasmopara halstedii]|eukprot:XP_024577219.1 hypothetical protein PHALS_11029 [Plasmopara halstedii]